MKLIHDKNFNRSRLYIDSLYTNRLNFRSISSRDYFPYLLITLLLIDVFLIVASWSYPSDYFTSDFFDMTREWGYAEMFQYAKEFAIAFIFFTAYKKTKDNIFIVWGLFFTYLLFDDSMKIHEIMGNAIASNLISKGPHIFNLRGQDFGELSICALVGSIFLILFIRYFYESRQTIKKISFNLIALVSLLLFCGVFIDMVHGALPNVTGITTLEDGGEMVAMSFICWYAFNLFKRSPETVICLLNNSTIKYANLVFDHLHGLVNFLHITPKKLAKKPY